MLKIKSSDIKSATLRFWIAWAIAELLLLLPFLYLSIQINVRNGPLFLFTQPLMAVLTLYKLRHPYGALVNLIIVCLYSFFSISEYFLGGNNGLKLVVNIIALANIQFLVLLLFWGFQKIASRLSK